MRTWWLVSIEPGPAHAVVLQSRAYSRARRTSPSCQCPCPCHFLPLPLSSAVDQLTRVCPACEINSCVSVSVGIISFLFILDNNCFFVPAVSEHTISLKINLLKFSLGKRILKVHLLCLIEVVSYT